MLTCFLFLASEIHILPSKINTNRVIGKGIPSKCNKETSICYYPNPTLIKIVFKLKVIENDKESLFILIKGIIPQEDITILNTYVANTGAPNF